MTASANQQQKQQQQKKKDTKAKSRKEKATINNPFPAKWTVLDRERSLSVMLKLGELLRVRAEEKLSPPLDVKKLKNKKGKNNNKKKKKEERRVKKVFTSEYEKWKNAGWLSAGINGVAKSLTQAIAKGIPSEEIVAVMLTHYGITEKEVTPPVTTDHIRIMCARHKIPCCILSLTTVELAQTGLGMNNARGCSALVIRQQEQKPSAKEEKTASGDKDDDDDEKEATARDETESVDQVSMREKLLKAWNTIMNEVIVKKEDMMQELPHQSLIDAVGEPKSSLDSEKKPMLQKPRIGTVQPANTSAASASEEANIQQKQDKKAKNKEESMENNTEKKNMDQVTDEEKSKGVQKKKKKSEKDKDTNQKEEQEKSKKKQKKAKSSEKDTPKAKPNLKRKNASTDNGKSSKKKQKMK